MRPWHSLRWFPVSALLCGTLLVSCATDEEMAQNADFGNSVRHMIALQTTNAAVAGTGLDGVKSEAVLHAYREDVAKPKEVEKDLIRIRLGQ